MNKKRPGWPNWKLYTFKNMDQSEPLFVYYRTFHISQFKYKIRKA